jgi:hypothetical protein
MRDGAIVEALERTSLPQCSAVLLQTGDCPPGTDKTAMDFRRPLPEIRWQSCLSPVYMSEWPPQLC